MLTNIQHILTAESSRIIKNKAIEIAETQNNKLFNDNNGQCRNKNSGNHDWKVVGMFYNYNYNQ